MHIFLKKKKTQFSFFSFFFYTYLFFDMDNFTQAETERPHPGSIPKETAFSIMFVSVGMSCFIYQAITSGNMFYKARKPIIGIVFAQAALGIIVTFVTLLTSIVEVDCTFVNIRIYNTTTSMYLFNNTYLASFIFCGRRKCWRYVATICFTMESLLG